MENFSSEFDNFIKNHPKGHFLQSGAWSELKNDWRSEIITVTKRELSPSEGVAANSAENDDLVGGMLVLIRKLPLLPYRLMYSPRGPVCDPSDRETFALLTQKARELAKREHAYALKIDPDIESSDSEFAQIARSLGYKIRATKNFEGIQPRYVFRLDVENKTEDEIFASFHSKTRYNIRVAKKNGVRIDIGSAADLPRFHEIMRETGARDNFVIRPLSYFQDMARHLGEHMRLYTAHWNDEIIAGTIAIHFGDKVWYLYGASSNSARNVMPNYLLQWEMIRWAIAEKCRIYDFRGVSGIVDESHPLYGLYRFKKGYGGQFTEFIGEMQLTFKPFIAFCVDKLLPIFMALRKKVMVKR